MTPAQRERAKEIVMVIGPQDMAPGKKMIYKTRPMKRGLAESRGARRLGIQIIDKVSAGTRVQVDHTQRVSIDGVDPRDARIAELEAQMQELFAASQKKKPGRKPKVKADADQA